MVKVDEHSVKGSLLRVAKMVAPWLVAVLAFWAVSYTFYAPQFDDKSLSQGDIAQYAGMSQDIREHRSETGEDPQWTGNMFSGMPAYLIDVEYPQQYVKRVASPIIKSIGDPMNMTFWAMALMMVAVVLMGVNPWLGIIAGLAYGLSTYFFLIIDAGHITKMWALVYAPPLVGAVWYALRRNLWLGASLAALFGSLEIGANHPQITYYFLLVCVAMWLSLLVEAWREGVVARYFKRTAVLAVAALLAVGSNISPLWYTLEHQRYTTRGVSEAVDAEVARQQKIEYNTAWSYGIGESLNMLVPNYMGASSTDINNEVVSVLQQPMTQSGIFNLAVDEYADAVTGERRSDVIARLESGDERCVQDVERIYSAISEEAWAYASNYWGAQPYTAGPTYIGAVVIFLALLALMLLPFRRVAWIVAVSLFAMLLAWGANIMGFYEVMYSILPGYNNFRTVSMALVVVEWAMPLLAVMALWAIIKSEAPKQALIKRIAIALGVVVVVVVAMMLTANYGLEGINEQFGDRLWVEQLRSAAYEGRHSALLADALRTTLYVALVAIVLVAYVVMRERLRQRENVVKWLTVAMTLVVAIVMVKDLVGVAQRYIYDEKWQDKAPTELVATTADLEILEDETLGFRVLDLTGDPFNSARASYFHRSVGGYHGAKLGRYQEVIDRYLRRFDAEVLAMLNTRYVIYDGEPMLAEWVTGVEPYGAAWLVDSVVAKEGAKAQLEALDGVDLRTVAVVDATTEGLATYYDAEGEIELVEYAPNRLRYDYRSATPSLVVFSEIYFRDGWSLYVDGQQMEYFVVDYILRGAELPAGEHSVEWRFEAPRWGVLSVIMAICSIAIFVAVICACVMKPKSENICQRIEE